MTGRAIEANSQEGRQRRQGRWRWSVLPLVAVQDWMVGLLKSMAGQLPLALLASLAIRRPILR